MWRSTRHALFVALLGPSALFAQGGRGDLGPVLDKLVSDRFAATRCPGLSVVVSANNEIIFSSAQGMADLEQRVPLGKNSVHRLASLSKPITGAIIMDLVEQRKLELDASVRRYLPELPEAYQDVTLRRLLDHQSGVRGYSNPMDLAFSMVHYATSRDAMKVFMAFPLAFQPGTKTEYSSLSFTVAGAVAEAVAGQSFQELSAAYFGRHRIRGIFLDDPLAVVPGRVRGYLVDPQSKIEFNDGRVVEREYLRGTAGPVMNARAYDISNRYPAGGFAASGEDLVRFVIGLGAGKILGREALREMWTPQPALDGTRGVFGIGWGVSQRKGQTMVGMNGAEPSTTAFLRYFPDTGAGAVVLCNAEGAQDLDKLLDDIVEAMLP